MVLRETVTRHLHILERAGLVQVTLRGRERVYSLDTGPLFSVGDRWVHRFR